MPVKAIDIPYSSHAAITCSSATDPPAWATYDTPTCVAHNRHFSETPREGDGGGVMETQDRRGSERECKKTTRVCFVNSYYK